MRRKNLRFMIAGTVLFAIAIAFFFCMLSIVSRSNNPAELMRTVGSVSGVVGGLAIALIAVGGIGKRV